VRWEGRPVCRQALLLPLAGQRVRFERVLELERLDDADDFGVEREDERDVLARGALDLDD